MNKFIYLTIVLGLVCVGLLTGCNQQSSTTPAPAAAPSTNAPATTNAPAQ